MTTTAKPAYTATLNAYNSRRDFAGNCYWAFTFTDHATGKVVRGTISGGESNIKGITFGWSEKNEWDRSIAYNHEELKIREFNRLTKGWPYAGCPCEDIANFIRSELAK